MPRLFKRMRDLTRPVRSRIRNRRKALQWALVGLYQRTCVRLDRWSEPYRIPLQEARARRIRSRLAIPVIGITGSSGKSTTTALLTHILGGAGTVRSNPILNSHIDITRLLLASARDTDFVVAEIGAKEPGAIKRTVEMFRPSVAVVTKVGVEHYSAFRGKDALAAEKSELVAALVPVGLAILNADDPLVMGMAERTKARIVTFGRSKGADYRVTGIVDGLPGRMRLTMECSRGRFEVQTRFLDESFWLATAAAFATAIELGIDPLDVIERIGSGEPVPGRLELLETPAGFTFILDTAKAPAESVIPSLEVLAKASVPYKTAIIGHISDFPGNPLPRYRDSYRRAKQVADRAIFVGENNHRTKATQTEMDSGVFVPLADAARATAYIRETARPGELILVKSSANLHLERIGLAFVQDVRCWVDRCGKKVGCLQCGLLHLPFESHPGTPPAPSRPERQSQPLDGQEALPAKSEDR